MLTKETKYKKVILIFVESIFLKYKNVIFNVKFSFFACLTSASVALVTMTLSYKMKNFVRNYNDYSHIHKSHN
jgi:hypothetical protein